MNLYAKRLATLRQLMQQHNLDAWVAPSADPHLSEYLPDHWQTRRWLSGFTGSVPTLIVTAKRAELWADSRYWEQATQQLAGSGIELQKLGSGRTHIDALADYLPRHRRRYALAYRQAADGSGLRREKHPPEPPSRPDERALARPSRAAQSGNLPA